MFNREADNAFLVGFFIGAVIGLGMGVLYAPRSGEETRYFIREKAEEVKEKAFETAEKIKETAAEMQKRANELAGDV